MPKKKSKKKAAARTDFARVSVVKEYLASKGMRTSASAVDALNDEIERLLDMAAARAWGSNRKTVSMNDV